MIRKFVLLVAVTFSATQAMAAQGTRVLTGRVFDDTTGCPLRGVTVRPQGSARGAVTDVQGRYRLAGVANGSIVEAVLRGYSVNQSLPLTADDPDTRVDFSLLRAPGDSARGVSYPQRKCQLEPPDQKP